MRKLTIGENFTVNRYYLRYGSHEFIKTKPNDYIRRFAIPDNSNSKLNNQYLYTYMKTEEGIKNIIMYFWKSRITFFENDFDGIIDPKDLVNFIIDEANEINKMNIKPANYMIVPKKNLKL